MTSHSVSRTFPASHPAAAGHFPGNPIIPGAVLLDEVISTIRAEMRTERRFELRTAKFLAPVRPGDVLTIGWTEEGEDRIGFECRAGDPARTVVVGTISCGAPAP
jgi:3-hydroxymyristoyl/3-hydroxydecanoyl-(acyl carrier protein) dehydratase